MTIIECIILGIVEGITEFLPISSTGHLILAEHLMKMPQTEFLKSFDIAIQVGAILAVVILYARSLILNKEIFLRVSAAFIPTAVIGFILYKLIKKFLLGNAYIVAVSLFVGGIILILFERKHQEKETDLDDIVGMTYKQAVLIGLFQTLAVVPGVSRSAATIIGGLLLGLKRKTIVEFSFLLAVPTMLAATGFDLLKSGMSFSSDQFMLLGLGSLVSFVIAVFSIKFLLFFIKNHDFVPFGVYRILVAIVFLIFM
ncbi:MAG: undecaprenyl-diphosphatase UppP [Candidatus Omnitrophica bacterium]|nr:undecaprenyl-diphosphatase UppP [Candidatus Omnitrophota bacterium]